MTQESLTESDAKPNSEGTADQPTTAATASKVEGSQTAPKEDAPKSAGADGAEDNKGTDAPATEDYDIKFSEGFEPDAELLGEFSAIAKELKLPGESAQKIAQLGEKLSERIVSRQLEALETARQGWETELKNDKEFGGDKLEANLAVAKKAVETFIPKEALPLLEPFHPTENPQGMGWGSHPMFVKLMHSIGKSISEDSNVVVQKGAGAQKASLAERLYGKPKQ
jgi:hypothetical protein